FNVIEFTSFSACRRHGIMALLEKGCGCKMKWLCIGAGSIGLLFAGKLASAGADLAIATRTNEQADALNVNGLTVYEGETIHTVRIEAAVSSNREAFGSIAGFNVPDVVLLTVKQKDLTDDLLTELQGLVGNKGILLCFQNG